MPLRPSKHARHSGKFKPAFIERRRAALELYLHALSSHRCGLHVPAMRIAGLTRGRGTVAQAPVSLPEAGLASVHQPVAPRSSQPQILRT